MKLNDQEMARDILLLNQQMIKSYTTAEIEAANKGLREDFGDFESDIKEIHTKLFNIMQTKGWYKTSVAGQQEIESEIITWEQKPLKEPELGAIKEIEQ